jgi:hypothetical protein
VIGGDIAVRRPATTDQALRAAGVRVRSCGSAADSQATRSSKFAWSSISFFLLNLPVAADLDLLLPPPDRCSWAFLGTP